MNAFLISFNQVTSNFLPSFVAVQEFMNNLEKEGVVSNVKVQKFENSILVKELTYNYNGQSWEQI
jgi:hypothetical protein